MKKKFCCYITASADSVPSIEVVAFINWCCFNVNDMSDETCVPLGEINTSIIILLVHSALVRTNLRAIAVTFVRLSVCLSGPGVHCDHMVHISADLSLWLDSSMFCAPWHQSMFAYSQPSFFSSTWKRGGVWMCQLGMISQERLKIEVKWLLSANRKSYMP